MSFQEAGGPFWGAENTVNLLRVTRGKAFPHLCQCPQSETPTDTPVVEFLTCCSEGEHTSWGQGGLSKRTGRERRKLSQNMGFGEVVIWGGSKEAGIHCGLRTVRNQGDLRIVSKST